MKENIILIGASDHCRYTIDIVEQENKYEIYGILDLNIAKGKRFAGYPVLGYLEVLELLKENDRISGGIVTIGDNYTRQKVVNDIKEIVPSFKFLNAIHPSVIVGKNVVIGSGCVFMAGVILNNDVVVKDHCFLATKSSLDHDSEIGEFSSLSPGVTTGGRVNIGSCTAIGIGAVILHYRTIGSNCVIGGGALVNKDVEDNILAYGVPARPVKKRTNEEKYL